MNFSLDQIVTIVKDASRLFYDREKAEEIDQKGFANYVTAIDKAVQKEIQTKLAEIDPSIQFVAEEKDNSTADIARPMWILDPVDGTANLIRDLHQSAISLGYAENGILTATVVCNPYRDELYTAVKGQGAFCNGKPIHVSKSQKLEECIIAAGAAPYNHEYADFYFNVLKDLFAQCQDYRRRASAVIDLCDVASGRVDAYFEHIYPWDRAAGMLLVEEAGGTVTRFDGSPVPLLGFTDIVAGPSPIVNLMYPVFRQHAEDLL